MLTALLTAYARLVYATARIRVATPIPAELTSGPVVFAVWHQQLAGIPAIHKPNRRYPLTALMSRSKDGTLIARIAESFGIRAARGSSHRGAVQGVRELLRATQGSTPHSLILTPDGPRGPRNMAKPGVVEIARLSKLPLVPTAAWCTHALTFNSWDAFRLPLPFSTIWVAYGAVLQHPSPQDVAKALNTLTAQARQKAGDMDNSATAA